MIVRRVILDCSYLIFSLCPVSVLSLLLSMLQRMYSVKSFRSFVVIIYFIGNAFTRSDHWSGYIYAAACDILALQKVSFKIC